MMNQILDFIISLSQQCLTLEHSNVMNFNYLCPVSSKISTDNDAPTIKKSWIDT